MKLLIAITCAVFISCAPLNARGVLDSGHFSQCPVQIEPAIDSPTAEYSVTFVAMWSTNTHPHAYPTEDQDRAHFSSMLAVLHNSEFDLWNVNAPASPGIEEMAETGATSTLRSEVQSAIDAGNASHIILGRTFDSPGTFTIEFTAMREYPLLSIVSMIAPSPDWFVGVRSIELYTGYWQNCIVSDLYPYDAGTEEGSRFSTSNPETEPRGTIQPISGSPFAAQSENSRSNTAPGGVAPLGRFVTVFTETVARQ